MTDTTSRTPKPPRRETGAKAKRAQSKPRPSMQADRKLIGRSIIGAGQPSKRDD
jgi:hypothetical protein